MSAHRVLMPGSVNIEAGSFYGPGDRCPDVVEVGDGSEERMQVSMPFRPFGLDLGQEPTGMEGSIGLENLELGVDQIRSQRDATAEQEVDVVDVARRASRDRRPDLLGQDLLQRQRPDRPLGKGVLERVEDRALLGWLERILAEAQVELEAGIPFKIGGSR